MKYYKKTGINVLRLAAALIAAVLSVCLLASCAKKPSGPEETPTEQAEPADDYVLKVGTLAGPTGMGMAKLINDTSEGGADEGKYDISIYTSPDEIRAALSQYLQEIRESRKAEGQDRIYIHGEKELESETRVKREGIPVNEKTLREIREIASRAGADLSLIRITD